MLKQIIFFCLLTAAILIIFVSVLPLSRSTAWWVRGWDYPKPQLAVLAAVVLFFWIVTARAFQGWPLLVTIGLIATCAFHLWRIAPMTPVWPNEVAEAEAGERARCISILSSNVLMENREAAPLIKLIEDRRPDVVLLLETDQWWADAMAKTAATYAVRSELPQDNHYGLMFMSDLEVISHAFEFLVEDEIPSIKARLRLRSGDEVQFYGLHPRPPTPGVDTDERDAELVMVAREVKEASEPSIVTGDLNDVAWSHTTRLFRRISGMLDPRVGRGLYSTFHAQKWYVRWPLDHLFHSNDFTVRKLERLPDIGSDHFPYFVELCTARDAAAQNAEPGTPQGDDEEEATKIIREGLNTEVSN